MKRGELIQNKTGHLRNFLGKKRQAPGWKKNKKCPIYFRSF